jgi:hypothetical protein
MKRQLALLAALMAFSAILLAGLLAGIYLADDAIPHYTPQQATSTTSTTTLKSTTTTSSTATSTTFLAATTTSLKDLEVSLSKGPFYRGDDLTINVSSDGIPVTQASAYLGGRMLTVSQGGLIRFRLSDGGDYNLTVSKEGYWNHTLEFTADKNTYATSADRRRMLSAFERTDIIREGKAIVSLYETTACPNCRAVASRLDKLVDVNRDCIAYEKLYYYRHTEKLSREFGVQARELPYIIIEGPLGVRKANGLVPSTALASSIRSVTGCDII